MLSYVKEFYSHENLRGSITLSVKEQTIEYSLREPGGAYADRIQLQECGADFTFTTFTSLGPDMLLLGGYHEARVGEIQKKGALAVLHFEPRGKSFGLSSLKWRGPEFTAATSMDMFPSGEQVALLDSFSDRVFVLDLETGTLREVANSTRAPALCGMKFIHVWPYPGSQGDVRGVKLWVTAVPEEDLGTGLLVGPSVSIIDTDGDGVFEYVR